MAHQRRDGQNFNKYDVKNNHAHAPFKRGGRGQLKFSAVKSI